MVPKNWVRSTAVGWVVLMAALPLLLRGSVELAGAGVLLVLLALGTAPAIGFGVVLGRVHAWSTLAAASVAGMGVFVAEFAALSDPNIHPEVLPALFAAGAFMLLFFAIPLALGAACGGLCGSGRSCWTAPR